MLTIKRGTRLVKRFRLRGVDLGKEMESIEFLFKERLSEHAPMLFIKRWPGDDVEYDPAVGICSVYFSKNDTRLLAARSRIYMDTRITYADGVIPEATIKVFDVNDTLFHRGGIQ